MGDYAEMAIEAEINGFEDGVEYMQDLASEDLEKEVKARDYSILKWENQNDGVFHLFYGSKETFNLDGQKLKKKIFNRKHFRQIGYMFKDNHVELSEDRTVVIIYSTKEDKTLNKLNRRYGR